MVLTSSKIEKNKTKVDEELYKYIKTKINLN